MQENDFIILRYEGKASAMAACTECQRKFFTPDSYYGDAIGAEKYLFNKFHEHRCEKERSDERFEAWLNRRG